MLRPIEKNIKITFEKKRKGKKQQYVTYADDKETFYTQEEKQPQYLGHNK